jgi:hypothetical protein
METYYIVKLSSGRTIELFVNNESEVMEFVESNMDVDEEIISIHERRA